MTLKLCNFLIALAALSLVAAMSARAQNQTSPFPQSGFFSPPRNPARITINPRPLLYRRCVDWYELQHRPSGTVLFPQMRCWWVRG